VILLITSRISLIEIFVNRETLTKVTWIKLDILDFIDKKNEILNERTSITSKGLESMS
jgi:hypothetical protein